METRLATKADAPILAELHKKSFGAARWNCEQIANSLALETTLALVVHEEGSAQGFILCQIACQDAEILTLCIVPAARRRGIGMFLLKAAREKAQQRAAQSLFLEVAADNVAALALYKKAGFRIAGRRAGYYRREDRAIDAVMMAFDL